jgi:probable phosphoglycerate mutase
VPRTRRVRTNDLENSAYTALEGLCELLLVRHGEQDISERSTLGEALDAPLSALGRAQAEAVGERLADARIDAVYASPLSRALDTGLAIAKHHGLEPVVDPDLREVDLWKTAPQDRRLLEIYEPAELADIFRNAVSARMHDAWPHAEDIPEFRRRAVGAIDAILEREVGRRIVVACHGGVINAYLRRVMDSDYDHLIHVHHTSITVVRAADGRRALLQVNDHTHALEAAGIAPFTSG